LIAAGFVPEAEEFIFPVKTYVPGVVMKNGNDAILILAQYAGRALRSAAASRRSFA